MLKKRVAGRTDAVIIRPREAVPIGARATGLPMSLLRIVDPPLAMVQNHIAGCSTDARALALLRKIDQSIVKLRADGTLNRLMTAR